MKVEEEKGGNFSLSVFTCFHCSVSYLYVGIVLQLTVPIEFRNCLPSYAKANILLLHFYLPQGKTAITTKDKIQASIHFVFLMLVNHITSNCHASQKSKNYPRIFLLLHIPKHKLSSSLMQYLLLIVS